MQVSKNGRSVPGLSREAFCDWSQSDRGRLFLIDSHNQEAVVCVCEAADVVCCILSLRPAKRRIAIGNTFGRSPINTLSILPIRPAATFSPRSRGRRDYQSTFR